MPAESVCYFRVDAPGPSWSSNIGAFGEPRVAGDNGEKCGTPATPDGTVRRFRTIQARPKDLRVSSGQPERAVRWHSGFRGGAHGPRDKAPIHHAARRRGGGVAAGGAGAAAGETADHRRH